MSEVSDKFINEVARPHMETFIRAIHNFDSMVADYNALQAGPDALPEDATDVSTGRTDAPSLTGLDVKQLRDFSVAMSAVVSPAAKQVLIGLMVRPLNIVLKD